MTVSAWRPEEAEINRFRKIQQLAYHCAETIAADLQLGVTEREVATRMKTFLLDHGVDDWFHQPFAWFGHRTAFRGLIGFNQLRGFNPAFYPGNKRLEENMPFILDCAPVMNGAVADIGYAGCLGQNAILDQLMDDLAEHRTLIVDQIRAGRSMAEVSRGVDQLCLKQGVDARHKAYPFSVLAHRVKSLDEKQKPRSVMRFGVRSITGLLGEVAQGRREGWSPLWSSSRRSDHAPTPGLWAVEPHLGFREVGAKFEELLVITESDAYWLDDDLPHVRRWRKRQLVQAA